MPIQNNNLWDLSCPYILIIRAGFVFLDQELQRLRSGMKSLVAANDEKVSYHFSPWSTQLYVIKQHKATRVLSLVYYSVKCLQAGI